MQTASFLVLITFSLICASTVNRAESGECLNDGDWDEESFRCNCKPGYDGPRCEVIKITLPTKKPYRFPLKTSPSNRFRLGFRLKTMAATKGTGTILSVTNHVKTTVVIGLTDGMPTLTVIEGNSITNTTTIKSKTVNDGNWIKIHVLHEGRKLIFVRIKCLYSDAIPLCTEGRNESNVPANFNMDNGTVCVGPCHVATSLISNKTEMLNNGLTDTCIADLFTNDVLQDMQHMSQPGVGCSSELSCGYSETDRYGKCGKNAVCYGTQLERGIYECDCKIGYASNTQSPKSPCDIKLSTYTVDKGGYVQWDVSGTSRGYYNYYEVHFRTFKRNGALLTSKSTENSLEVTIENSILTFRISGNEFQVENVNVTNGEWIILRMTRLLTVMHIFLQNNGTITYRTFWSSSFPISEISPIYKDRIAGVKKDTGSDDSFEGCMTDAKMLLSWNMFPMENRTFRSAVTNKNMSMKDVTGKYLTTMNTTNVRADAACQGYNLTYCEIHHPCRADQKSTTRWRSCGCECSEPDKTELPSGPLCVFKNVCRGDPCQNNGTCHWNGTSFEDRNFSCTCLSGFSGNRCETILPPPATQIPITQAIMPWWAILLLLLFLLLLLCLLLFLFVKNRRRERAADSTKVLDERFDVDEVYENPVCYEDEGGGEVDYLGEIDFSAIRKPANRGSMPLIVPSLPIQSGRFDPKPLPFDWKNPDLENDDHLDHPLEYGYEGAGSIVTLSSIVTGSTDRDLDFNDVGNLGSKFRGLSELYR